MLYTMSRDKDLQLDEVLVNYRKNIKKSFELYLFNVLQLVKIARYSKNDAAQRAAKHLPSEEDKNFTSKLYDNDLIQSEPSTRSQAEVSSSASQLAHSIG